MRTNLSASYPFGVPSGFNEPFLQTTNGPIRPIATKIKNSYDTLVFSQEGDPRMNKNAIKSVLMGAMP